MGFGGRGGAFAGRFSELSRAKFEFIIVSLKD